MSDFKLLYKDTSGNTAYTLYGYERTDFMPNYAVP